MLVIRSNQIRSVNGMCIRSGRIIRSNIRIVINRSRIRVLVVVVSMACI